LNVLRFLWERGLIGAFSTLLVNNRGSALKRIESPPTRVDTGPLPKSTYTNCLARVSELDPEERFWRSTQVYLQCGTSS
jgi:hypothetical protein